MIDTFGQQLDIVIMVKDEAELLKQTLESILTPDMFELMNKLIVQHNGGRGPEIRNVLSQYASKLIYDQTEWSDFSTNRNRLLFMSRQQGSHWAIMLDAGDICVNFDELICNQTWFMLQNKPPGVMCPWMIVNDGVQGNVHVGDKIFLLNVENPYVLYEGIIHESLPIGNAMPVTKLTSGPLVHVKQIRNVNDSKQRASESDIGMLLNSMSVKGWNLHDVHYLRQTYNFIGDRTNARLICNDIIDHIGLNIWEPCLYLALLNLGEIFEVESHDLVVEQYKRCHEYAKQHRVHGDILPMLKLANWYHQHGKHKKVRNCINAIRHVMPIPMPGMAHESIHRPDIIQLVDEQYML